VIARFSRSNSASKASAAISASRFGGKTIPRMVF
jgi:hypothetical protein